MGGGPGCRQQEEPSGGGGAGGRLHVSYSQNKTVSGGWPGIVGYWSGLKPSRSTTGAPAPLEPQSFSKADLGRRSNQMVI